MPDRDKGAPMTPERRMCEAIAAATREYLATDAEPPQDVELVAKHGAAAIEAALAEQRALLAAWFDDEAKILEAQALERDESDIFAAYAMRERAKDQRETATYIRAGEPEAWAERTGWKMEETPDAAA